MKPSTAAIFLLVLASPSYARAPQAAPAASPAAAHSPAAPAASPAAAHSSAAPAAAAAAASPAPARLESHIYEWNDLPVEKRPNGVRRAVFDNPTQTLDRLHTHITTLNPGQTSGEPRLHEQEEVIIVKEGSIDATFDGQKRRAGPGSIIFFAAHAVTSLANAGPSPATYYVINYHTPPTPPAADGAGGAQR